MLQNFLEGKIPPVCSDDPESLGILLTKCKKNLQQVADSPDLFDQAGTGLAGRLSLVSLQMERKEVLVNRIHLSYM